MAATKTLYRLDEPHNCIRPHHGVITVFGYGINIRVDRGHLLLEDGIGSERGRARLPRVGHGLKRLVVIGADGMVSLAALLWLADQDAAFVMLDRDGSVLATTGPVRSSDARLRRAQALAHESGAALVIARELISRKLAGQEQVARDKLLDTATADLISQYAQTLASADTLDAIRLIESRAAAAYWAAWQQLPIMFPKTQVPRIPSHWQRFGTRKSPLTGSPRLAVNPPNAILNYLYAILESEAGLAAAALGLDPGLDVLHVDTPARDSLACDLMEAVRPNVDGYVLDWITRQPLRREWLFEQRNGSCRLMGPFAAQLAETAQTWARAVAPVAEWVARTLWARRPAGDGGPATRLTQSRRREARGIPSPPPNKTICPISGVCRICGTSIPGGRSYCLPCSITSATERMTEVARSGRIAAHTAEAESRRSATQRGNALARWEWQRSDDATGIDARIYDTQIQPQLKRLTNSAIASAIGVSLYYAAEIRRGRRRPHPRHWQRLAKMVGISAHNPKVLQGNVVLPAATP